MAKHSLYTLTDFFNANHCCTPYEIDKAVIAAVTGRCDRTVLVMFKQWRPVCSRHYALKLLALSAPRPLTRGQITPNVTEVRKKLEDFAYGHWRPEPGAYTPLQPIFGRY